MQITMIVTESKVVCARAAVRPPAWMAQGEKTPRQLHTPWSECAAALQTCGFSANTRTVSISSDRSRSCKSAHGSMHHCRCDRRGGGIT